MWAWIFILNRHNSHLKKFEQFQSPKLRKLPNACTWWAVGEQWAVSGECERWAVSGEPRFFQAGTCGVHTDVLLLPFVSIASMFWMVVAPAYCCCCLFACRLHVGNGFFAPTNILSKGCIRLACAKLNVLSLAKIKLWIWQNPRQTYNINSPFLRHQHHNNL